MRMDLCTLHQRVRSGYPVTQGSEVRMPDGTPIPGVVSLKTEAIAGTGLWRTTIEIHALFGEAIGDLAVPVIDPGPAPVPAPPCEEPDPWCGAASMEA
jgi:hypothetical protein